MVYFDFEIKGRINAYNLDDAITLIEENLDDSNIKISKMMVDGKKDCISVVKPRGGKK